MSFNLNIGSLLDDLKETNNRIELSVNNITNSKNRLLVELSKSTTGDAKILDAKKHELLCQASQQMLHTLANFVPTEDNDQQKNAADDKLAGSEKENFEKFSATVENRCGQINAEAVRLSALNDIIANIDD